MTYTLPSSRTLTANITKVFRLSTPEQRAAGFDWYADANDTAIEFATTYGVTVSQAAGVIAALSPLNSWGANVKLARRMIASGGTLTTGYLTVGLTKARAILAGASPAELLTSDKVAAFYHGILHRGATDRVTVDRHAFDIAVGKRHTDATRPNIGKKAYREVGAAYVRAAAILSREAGIELSAAQVQAIVWVAWRNRFWAEGAFDGTE